MEAGQIKVPIFRAIICFSSVHSLEVV